MHSLEPPAKSRSFVLSTPEGPQYDDHQQLLHNFDKDRMDFSIFGEGESWVFSSLVTVNKRSRSGRRQRRRTSVSSIPMSPHRGDRSTTDTRQRVLGRSGRNDSSASDPALAATRNDTDSLNRMAQGTNIELAENLRHSIAVTVDRSVQASQPVAFPTGISAPNQHIPHRPRRRRKTSNKNTLSGARTDRSKKYPRIPKNVDSRHPRPETSRINVSNLTIIAEQARSSIECPICLCNFDENADRVPCTMRCGHSMCLSHSMDVGGRCPVCRSSLRGQVFKKSVALCDAAASINSILTTLTLE